MTPRLTEAIGLSALGEPAGPETFAVPAGNFLKSGLPVWLGLYGLNLDFPAFQGHFEGRPVLPALAQTLLAKDLAGRLWPELDRTSAIVSAKFLGLVEPPAVVSVYAQPPAAGPGPGQWRFQLTAARAGGPAGEAAALRLELSGLC
ncbi:MAG: hypothetical protein LBV70_00045 [Candidatus Adiutrix sp.]|jgi:hypothetical protein|nr:hypothetical protein [Candidatus Adiutrix sp.]